MAAAADVARIPVLEIKLFPGRALMMELAFSLGSTGVDNERTPMLEVSICRVCHGTTMERRLLDDSVEG